MQRLDPHTFRAALLDYDAQVARTPDIDRFCSSSCWVMPAFDALSADHELWAWRAETTSGYAALCRGAHPRVGRYLQPLEASWGLASPFAGRDVGQVIAEFSRTARQFDAHWDILFLTGIHENSRQFHALVRGFQRDYFMGIGPSMGRQYAGIKDGVEGFLSRRSSKFRANIRRELRQAQAAGVTFEWLDRFEDDKASLAAFERIIQVEKKSWKGLEGAGITEGRMYQFYRSMFPCLAKKSALRVQFARLNGQDIAYGFGGIFQDTFRGLQMSFDQHHHKLSPGNLVQMELIRQLHAEGVQVYDMGQSMDYKKSWTDKEFETVAVIVRR